MTASASAIRFGGALVRRGRSAAAVSVHSGPALGVLSGVLLPTGQPTQAAQSVGGGLLLDLNCGGLGPAAALGATRTAVTKSRRRRDAKKKRRARLAELGIEQKPPSWHIPRDTPIVNALSLEDRSRESREYDQKASALLKEKIGRQDEALRFDFTGLKMSDRVRKLFDLTNGSQKEVVKAQKKRGMELFQLREGDTGSSAVQSEFVGINSVCCIVGVRGGVGLCQTTNSRALLTFFVCIFFYLYSSRGQQSSP